MRTPSPVYLTLLLLPLFFIDAYVQQEISSPEKEKPLQKTNPTLETRSPKSPAKTTAPTGSDMENLARAMHGAAGQQPADAPKDEYGKPYIIGNLGGVPVNLPSSKVQFVEYDDSPGWDPEKIRNYRPAPRNYDSVLMSFGFHFRNRDAKLPNRIDYDLVQAKNVQRIMTPE